MADPRLVLAIDTATVVTVGLAHGDRYLAGDVVEDRLAQVEQLMPTVARVAKGAGVALGDVGQIVVGLGPGPFTGLRVGVVTAQVLSSTLGARLHGICTLDVIAAQHAAGGGPDGDFLVVTDARRKELYWARYGADGARVCGPAVDRPDQLPDVPTVGPGVDVCPDLPGATAGPRRLEPRALAIWGPTLPDAGTTPLYLRRPDASAPIRRKSVLAHRLDRTGRGR